MHKVLKRMCWAIILPIWSFVFPCPSCRRRRGLFKVPNDYVWTTATNAVKTTNVAPSPFRNNELKYK